MGFSFSSQNFLQGLLTKDPRQRLSWPDLLHHPFIAGRVTSESSPGLPGLWLVVAFSPVFLPPPCLDATHLLPCSPAWTSSSYSSYHSCFSFVRMAPFHGGLETLRLSLAKWTWWLQPQHNHVLSSPLSAVITEPAGSDLGAPFTSRLPPELQVLKDEQAHRLAPKGNQSRLLRQACKRMAEEAKQKVCGSEENTWHRQASDLGELEKEVTFKSERI